MDASVIKISFPVIDGQYCSVRKFREGREGERARDLFLFCSVLLS